MNNPEKLRTTEWLAQYLGLSVRTLEKMRSKQPELLPPCIRLNRSTRYDQQAVDEWLQEKRRDQSLATPVIVDAGDDLEVANV